MTHLIDLMPESCRGRIRRRKATQRWIAAYAIVGGAVAILATTSHIAQASRLSRVKALREAVQLDAGQRVEADKIEKQLSAIRHTIDRQARLASPVRVSDVIAVIGAVMPRSVSLTSLSVTPRVDRGPLRARSGSQQEARGEPEGRLIVELTGVAPDDVHMANLVAGLESHPMFMRISIDHARKSVIRGTEGREFGLTCEIDLSAQFVAAAMAEVAP